MAQPSIAVINFSSRPDPEVQQAIRAVNRQIGEDFMPIWGQGRELQLYASQVDPSDHLDQERVQADSVLYLVNESTLEGALGYHDMNTAEIPVGFVFTEAGGVWTTTLSHEALELILDPNVNVFVPGPDPEAPDDPNRWYWHTYEVCDAVERMSYAIDGVAVSDFVTPTYFRPGDAKGTRNDFLGVGVPSFGVMPGCHLGVVDPVTLEFSMIFGHKNGGGIVAKARREAYDRPKPSRPEEGILAKYLATAKHRRVNALGPRRAGGVAALGGITRTGRYQARASALKLARPRPAR